WQSAWVAARRMRPRPLFVAGASSRLDWVAELRALAPARVIYNHYGPPETTVGALAYRVGRDLPQTKSATLPLGTPLPNAVVRVVDDAGQPVAVGEQGELYIGGHGVARGYLNRPELTAERFVADPLGSGGRVYLTGHVGRRLA